MAAPTLRSLARVLPFSRTTISDALRGSPRVNPETARAVRAAVSAAGYRPNLLASAVMSELRRSRGGLFRGVLAVVILDEPERPAHADRFFGEMVRGIRERAGQLDFRVEVFSVGPRGVSWPRLGTILRSRGITGLLLFPTWGEPDFSGFDFSVLAALYVDYAVSRPPLNSLCSEHYRSLMDALHRLHALGYRRPGLVLQRHQGERIQHRWESAVLAFQRHAAGTGRIPPLLYDAPRREPFLAWFRRHRPDVVLAHDTTIIAWMGSAGARIPATHGFFCLNLTHATAPCAGLDLQPRVIGARATELLVGQLLRNERGIPECPSLNTIGARWVDGPTLRSAAARVAPQDSRAKG